ncbi:MAG TPA: hypothetical protein VF789_09235 [Thermoanaerobaculia bacterium]
MRSLSIVPLCLLIATAATGQPLPQPDSSPLFIHNVTDIAERAAQEMVGHGVPLPGGRSGQISSTTAGSEIVWREVRDETDSRGGRHVFYSQHVIDRGIEAELFGSEIGLHYSASGELRNVGGRQFTSVSISNRPAFTAAQAVDRALQRLRSHPGFRPGSSADLLPSQRAYRKANTRLKLVQSGDTFRYAYFTFANDERGVEHNVVIDAQSEEVLAVSKARVGNNCNPTGPWTSVNARGIPVRPELRGTVTRSLKANVAPNRSPFTHEGFYYATPTISALQETNNPTFACGGVTPAYTLIPLSVDGTTGYPTYRNVGEWQGSAAGDAMYHTYQTMQALISLGRNGWDNNFGDANIVVESTLLTDAATFVMDPEGDPRLPPTPSVAIGRAVRFYSNAAALDVVGHEWGHGVVMTTANFPYETLVGAQLHEGFADVIGQAVEKLRQPAGAGLERSSDWTLHEDNGTSGYARGALDDGTAGHRWYGFPCTPGELHCCNGTYCYTFNDKLHREDEPGTDTIWDPHARGNMLSVVLRLLSEGGRNPICSRLPALSGCTTTVQALGVSGAARILLNTLSYTPSTARWEDLPIYANWAAFQPFDFVTPQIVDDAFVAIGYPRPN